MGMDAVKINKIHTPICVCSALVILRFGVRCWPDPQIFLHQKLFPNLISIKLHRNSLFCLNSSKASQQRMTALLLKQFSITKLFLLSFLLIESNSKLFNANWLQMITAEKSGSLLFSGGQISPIVPGGGGTQFVRCNLLLTCCSTLDTSLKSIVVSHVKQFWK